MLMAGTRGDGAVLVHVDAAELGRVPMLDPSGGGTSGVAASAWVAAGFEGLPPDMRPEISAHGSGATQSIEFAFRVPRRDSSGDSGRGPGNAF